MTNSPISGGTCQVPSGISFTNSTDDNDAAALRRALARFQRPTPWRSYAQLATSFVPFVAIVAAMYALLGVSYWLTLGLAPLAAGFVVRIFIIQHDCGHGAFLASRRANDFIGALCSLVTLTPYRNWRRQHAHHHANWNNLDRRESGADIYSSCLTTDEYAALSRRQQMFYRLVRHPIVVQFILPPLVFLALYRFPFDTPRAWRRERWSVLLTNISLATLFVGLGLLAGFGSVAIVHLPIATIAAIVGVWLFSVQHRFESVRWYRQTDWTASAASLVGTSWLRLPRILQWFTGNIGFHHVHHLNPRIPNYRLEPCHRATPALQGVPALSLSGALRGSGKWLWDEARGRLVRFPSRRDATAAD